MSTQQRCWTDRVATVYRERADGRIEMIPIEIPTHHPRTLLGILWKGDDFDNDRRCYQRIAPDEADRLVGN